MLVVLLVSIGIALGSMVKVEQMTPHFNKLARAAGLDRHEVVIAVKQLNLNHLEERVLEMSNPRNQKYQKWMKPSEVTELTKNIAGSNKILTWLQKEGISVKWVSKNHFYIKAEASISKWEEVLETQFYQWKDDANADRNDLLVRCTEYSLPEDLIEHVSTLFYTVQPPPVINKQYVRGPNNQKKTNLRMRDFQDHGVNIHLEATSVTPSFLNNLYGIPHNIGSATQNQSVFSTSSQYWSPNDLTTFQQQYDLTQQQPIDIGGFITNSCSTTGSGKDCTEGNLDLQYLMAISQVTSTIYWYVGGGDPFVDWIVDVADEENPPQSNSISWGSVEQTVSVSTLNQFNTEALKLSAMGVTIMVASGDNGVANFGCPCSDPDNPGPYNCACNADSSSFQSDWPYSSSWSGTGYFPSFPATNPYVVAVGATMGPENNEEEIACQANEGGVITSGGGFSTYYPQPSWQTEAVSNYFASLTTSTTPTSGYNPNGRAIPDISLIGVRYQVVITGNTYSVYGTSASSPVFAGMISLINAIRIAQNMTTVGFINPTLYDYGTHGSVGNPYNKIASGGHNRCCVNSFYPDDGICCDAGFYVTDSLWDPVTGWGSIQFPMLASMFSATATHYPSPVPTYKPTAYPTPTHNPSRVPTKRPTPLPGTPTLAPSDFDSIQVKISQVIKRCEAGLFYSHPVNTLTFQEAVLKSINDSYSVVINSIYNYHKPNTFSNLFMNGENNNNNINKQDNGQEYNIAVSRELLLDNDDIIFVNYTVKVHNEEGESDQDTFNEIVHDITTTVNSGEFTSLLQYRASINNATDLMNVTSDYVRVSSNYRTVNDGDDDDNNLFGSSSIGNTVITIIVVILVSACLCTGCTYCYRRMRAKQQYRQQAKARRRSSSNSNILQQNNQM